MKLELGDNLEAIPTKEREEFLGYIAMIHKHGINRGNAAPFHLFALASTYIKIFKNKMNSRGSQSDHLKKGLEKL
jgi:hypothetical protein